MIAGERRDRRGVGREHCAYLRRWARGAGGDDVAGWTQWPVMYMCSGIAFLAS